MHMRRFCRARARTQEKHWRFESRYARPDQEHTWSGGEELIAVRLDLRAYTPTFAAHWMLAPRYGSITAPLSEQIT